jgi:hypothetical protein
MDKLLISPTPVTPEIRFSPEENIFLISGTSSPEDVRAMYYPVLEWIKQFIEEILEGRYTAWSAENPLVLKVDLYYFNSSSAKFYYDIFLELKRLSLSGIPVNIEWYFDEEDTDMQEAGADISLLVDMEFTYMPKERK